jgi:hypothetical protein
VKFLAILLRYFSIAFSLLYGLFMTGVSAVLLLSGSGNFRFEMFPFWKGNAALYWLLGLGLFGTLAAVLAFVKKLMPLLVVFTLVLAGLMIYGFFINPVYRFGGAAEAKGMAWLAFGAVGAFFGSLMQFEKPRRG